MTVGFLPVRLSSSGIAWTMASIDGPTNDVVRD